MYAAFAGRAAAFFLDFGFVGEEREGNANSASSSARVSWGLKPTTVTRSSCARAVRAMVRARG